MPSQQEPYLGDGRKVRSTYCMLCSPNVIPVAAGPCPFSRTGIWRESSLGNLFNKYLSITPCARPGKVPEQDAGALLCGLHCLCSTVPWLRDGHVSVPYSRCPGPAEALEHSTLGLCAFANVGPSLGTQGESAILRQQSPVASQTPAFWTLRWPFPDRLPTSGPASASDQQS